MKAATRTGAKLPLSGACRRGVDGGIIEDFVDNMDAFDQDLLEDFTLVIGDGIEIA